jgi:hypothetical protein
MSKKKKEMKLEQISLQKNFLFLNLRDCFKLKVINVISRFKFDKINNTIIWRCSVIQLTSNQFNLVGGEFSKLNFNSSISQFLSTMLVGGRKVTETFFLQISLFSARL